MKKTIFSLAVLVACSAFAAPVLEYNFTTGKMFPKAPEMAGKPEIRNGVLVLDAEKKQMLTFPAEVQFSPVKGGTLYAVVRFGEDGKLQRDPKTGKYMEVQGSYSALFFRNAGFVLGMEKKKLYLNFGRDKKRFFNSGSGLYGKLPNLGKWCTVAATMKTADGITTATIYCNGKKIGMKKFADIYDGNKESITFGKAWGGVWYFSGEVAKIGIYSDVLSAEEVAKLNAADASLMK